ncbi:MAG: phosphoribosylformylglycinamidine synthase [Planctomycetota bacterium]|nr:MAG: phosphoribosylformylglycinamidine synthase [Planctomycetota bacterium]
MSTTRAATSAEPGTSDAAAYWSVRITPRSPALDAHGREVLAEVRQMGLSHVEAVRTNRLYFFHGRLEAEDIRRLAAELLADPVAERFTFEPGLTRRDDTHPAVEVHTLPGVMNPLAMSTLGAARHLLGPGAGDDRLLDVRTARRYEILGARSADELHRIAADVLANDCIERWYVAAPDRHDPLPDSFPVPPQTPFELRHVPIRDLSDEALETLSRDAHLFLSLDEMRTIQAHYATLGRDPTDLELETLAQTWSEHCVHKTLKSAVEYRGPDFGREGTITRRFDNLLKETIAAATKTLDRDWCLSVFADNAGVIAFDEAFGLAMKVETHNHPSALEPYGGAATGIGGCIRDILGCGLGAKPIASTDVFCLAPPDWDPDRLPAGVLHPRRVLKGVVAGVRDYGNRMGIPTVNGALAFDERYLANPLVFCGCLGLIPRHHVAKRPRTGDRIVLAGGRTGRDGIHGATFSSAELTADHADEFAHAVQIGHAIEEKKLLDALLLARDHPDGPLYTAVTDCGAGGLSSAVGEMGAALGAEVDLDKVPLKYSGLRYDEIWISEAQERMVFAVPEDHLETFLRVFREEEVEATVIGTFTGDRVLRVRYRGTIVGELEMSFLHEGLPKRTLSARWNGSARAGAASSAKPPVPNVEVTSATRSVALARAKAEEGDELRRRLLGALRAPDVASKEWIIRQYDHEVQGRSVVKPLVGPGGGPADGAVLRPRYDRDKGVALSGGLGICRDEDDPYWMAVFAVDEALRNAVCVGADPMRTAILDNFCWPRVDGEEALGALVRTCVGAHDAAVAFGLPFISGKDSLNNEYAVDPQDAARTGLPPRLAIPYTLLITAVGIVPDVNRCVTPDLKRPGNRIVLASAPVERAGFDAAREVHHRVASLIASGDVSAAHDISDGGALVTAAEMCIASTFGARLDLEAIEARVSLFDPIRTSYLLETAPDVAEQSGWPVVGEVIEESRLELTGRGETVSVPVDELRSAWRGGLWEGES